MLDCKPSALTTQQDCMMLCDLFTIVGKVTTKTGGEDLNLCGFYLLLLNPSVE